MHTWTLTEFKGRSVSAVKNVLPFKSFVLKEGVGFYFMWPSYACTCEFGDGMVVEVGGFGFRV